MSVFSFNFYVIIATKFATALWCTFDGVRKLTTVFSLSHPVKYNCDFNLMYYPLNTILMY